jgi:hypothetical protein
MHTFLKQPAREAEISLIEALFPRPMYAIHRIHHDLSFFAGKEGLEGLPGTAESAWFGYVPF